MFYMPIFSIQEDSLIVGIHEFNCESKQLAHALGVYSSDALKEMFNLTYTGQIHEYEEEPNFLAGKIENLLHYSKLPILNVGYIAGPTFESVEGKGGDANFFN